MIFEYQWCKLSKRKFGWPTSNAISDQFENVSVQIDNWQPNLASWWKIFQKGRILCNKQSADLDKYLT